MLCAPTDLGLFWDELRNLQHVRNNNPWGRLCVKLVFCKCVFSHIEHYGLLSYCANNGVFAKFIGFLYTLSLCGFGLEMLYEDHKYISNVC